MQRITIFCLIISLSTFGIFACQIRAKILSDDNRLVEIDFSKVRKQIYENRREHTIIKNIKYLRKRVKDDPYFWGNTFPSYPRTGFDAFCPYVEITPVDIPYPDKNWKLFNVDFKKNTFRKVNFSNIIMNYGNRHFRGLAGLIAVNKKSEVRFIVQAFTGRYDKTVEKDYELDKSNPVTYEKFLELIWYFRGTEDLKYDRREGEYFIFKGKRTDTYDGRLYALKEFKVHPDSLRYPSQEIVIDSIGPEPKWRGTIKGESIDFTDHDTKVRQIKSTIMGNVYMYAFYQKVKDLELTDEQLKDSIRAFFPAPDEYLCRLKILPIGKLGKVRLPEGARKPIVRDSMIIGYTRQARGVEFYQFSLDIERKLGVNPVLKDCYNRSDTMLFTNTLPALPICPEFLIVGYPDPLPPPPEVPQRLLVAWDNASKTAYIISGKDVFINKSRNLYIPSPRRWTEIQKKEMSEWSLMDRLGYLHDLLYPYSWCRVREEDMVYEDKDKVIFESSGACKDLCCFIRYTMEYDNPENIKMERMTLEEWKKKKN